MSRVFGVVACVFFLLAGVLVSPAAAQDAEPAPTTTTTVADGEEPVAPATTEDQPSTTETDEATSTTEADAETTMLESVTSALGTTIVEETTTTEAPSTTEAPVAAEADEKPDEADESEATDEIKEEEGVEEELTDEEVDERFRPDGLEWDDPTAPPLPDGIGLDNPEEIKPPEFDPEWEPETSIGVDILSGELTPIDSVVRDDAREAPAVEIPELFDVPESGEVLPRGELDIDVKPFEEVEVEGGLNVERSTALDGLPISVVPRRADLTRIEGASVTARVAPRELALQLSEVGLAFELDLSGFDTEVESRVFAEGLSPEFGIDSGWSIEIDPTAFDGAPAGLIDRLGITMYSQCDEKGCEISHLLDTARTDDGQISTVVPSEVLLSIGGPDRADARSTVRGIFEERSAGFAAMTGDGNAIYFGVSSTANGAQGDFAASPLESLVTYQVGLSTGYAESSYQIPVPPAVGPQPTVAFSYSSGAVDGMNTTANNQASQIGIGWSHSIPVITRATHSCSDEGAQSDFEHNLCLPLGRDDGFSLSMNGVGGKLVRTSTGTGTTHPQWGSSYTYHEYVLENANGWRIRKVERAALSNPAAVGHIPDRWGTFWEITTEDGTLHVFGRNWVIDIPNSSTPPPLQQARGVHSDTELNSVMYAPAYVAEPNGTASTGCAADPELCNVATAWYLDQVIDTNGNMSINEYWRELNYYKAQHPGGTTHLQYTRSVNLEQHMYGRTFGDNATTNNKFMVNFQYNFGREDKPIDMACGSANCTKNSPSFWTEFRLATVRTFALAPQTQAGLWAFGVSIPGIGAEPASPDSLDDGKMQLNSIQRQGLNPVTFGYDWEENRVNHPPGVPAMNMQRLTSIENELGGEVTFDYFQPYAPVLNGSASDPCSAGTTPSGGYKRLPCNMFISYDSETGGGGFVLWNSFVVQTQTSDATFGQDVRDEVLTFSYPDPPNWAYSSTWGFEEYETAQCKKGFGCNHWNDYRGHEQVNVVDAAGNRTEHFFYTGMRQDRYSVSDVRPLHIASPTDRAVLTRSSNLANRDNNEYFAGRTLGYRELTSGGAERYRMMNLHYSSDIVGTTWPFARRDTESREYPKWQGPDMPAGGSGNRIRTFYNDHSQVERVTDEGHIYGLYATAADNVTTFYNYEPNTTDWIVGLPSQISQKAGTLAVGSFATGPYLAHAEMSYDGASQTTPPEQGNMTESAQQFSGTITTTTTYTHNTNGTINTQTVELPGTDAVTAFEYDSYGHVDEIDGPLAADTTTFDVDPRFGAQIEINAPNNQNTYITLDSLGRTTAVQYPGDTNDTQWFFYSVSTATAPAEVMTKSNNQTTENLYSWEMVDGFGRAIQTQTRAENGVAINVVSTTYDNAGRPYRVTQPYQEPTGGGTLQPWTITSTPRTVYTYDTDGLVRTRLFNSSSVVEIDSSVRTQGWRTTSTDPLGNVTVSNVDVDGNLISVTDADNETTDYRYNLRNDLVEIEDPDGNLINTYYNNNSAQPSSMSDPDLGTITYNYDNAGRLLSQEDARENEVFISYNVASQPVSMNLNSATGPQVSAWVYDNSGRMSSTVHNNLVTASSTAQTVTTSFDYDARNRIEQKTWTIPGLSGGSQNIDYTYRQLGSIDTITYPNGTVDNYGFNTETEQPVSLTTNGASIGSGVRYNPAGQVTQIQRGLPDWTSENDAALHTTYTYDDTNRIDSISTQGLAEEGWIRHSLIRMYRSAFDRNPDQSGWGYWLPQYAQGLPLANIAQTFVYSTEFANVWSGYTDPWDGTPHDVSTNAGLVQWAYGHILNLPAASRGWAPNWVARLDNGTWTRGQMIREFTIHAEARANPGVGGSDATLPIQTINTANADVPQELDYTWDDAGNLTRLHETSQGVNQYQCFGYDNLHRLTSGYTRNTSSCTGFQGGGPFPFSVAYNYDNLGNITNASGTHTVSGSYTYGSGNQNTINDAGVHAATAAGPHTYQYDDAGNQTLRSLNNGASITNLTYDVLNRLVGTSGSGADLTALYDADGNRVKRTLDRVTTFYLGENYEIEISAPVDEATVGLYALNARTFNISNDLASVGGDVVTSPYGTAGDIAVIGDWDGDGYDNAGVYRQSNNRFYFGGIPANTGSFPSVPYGVNNDQGIVGDWDGDGDDTIAVYRSSNSAWYFRNDHNPGAGEFATIFGITGDIPLVGDWNGNGIDSIGLYRPSSGTFYLRDTIYGPYTALVGVGTSEDKPIAGDWDGDGIDTIGFYRPSNSRYYLKNTNTGSGIDITTNPWGNGTSPPIAGNFNASVGHDGQQITINHQLAGVSVGSTINGEFHATATDHLGSTGITRDEDAHTRTQRYTPYGAVRAASYNSNMPVDESFTGQTTDPGLGLIDYNARHYDPQLGRFIQADPVLAGLNRYSYVWNNPLRYTDPTGNEPCPKSGCTVQTHTYGTVQAWNRTITQPTSGNGSGASAAAEHSARILAAIADTGYRPDPQDIRDAQDGALIVGSGFPVLGEFIDAAACGSGFGWNLETAADCGGLAIPFVGGRAIRRITGIAPNPARFCSFSGETEVLMADGTTKPISEIEIGDFVLAEDPETGERGARQVTQLWVHEDSLVDLEINGHDIATTEDHPFWNHTDGEWQRADALDRGDLLLTADGELLVVDGLDWGSARTTTAYNLTVDDIHTYYVRIGERDVLVHNQCGELLSKPSQIAERLGVSPREVNDAIHALKPNIPSGGPVKNPDVVVDVVSGEVFPQIPGGGLGDSIGNIFDVLPGGN